MSKTFSGKQAIKILCKDFGFCFVSQKGSHVKLEKTIRGKVVAITIVPLHKELSPGTLDGALKLARINRKEFKGKK